MPSPLIIEGTQKTPDIILDQDNKTFSISGMSIVDNGAQYYAPVVDWILEYLDDSPYPETTFDFKLKYINTTTFKALSHVVFEISEKKPDDCQFTVNWHYEKEDDDLKETGMELAEVADLPFEFIAY